MSRADAYRHVNPGERAILPADGWNGAMDAAVDLLRRKRSRITGEVIDFPFGDTALVWNQSSGDIARWGVLGLEDALVRPIQDEGEFLAKPAFIGVDVSAEHRGRFGIAVEPIPQYAVGRMCIGGLTPARVKLLTPIEQPDFFADVLPGENGSLGGAAAGAARIIWHEPSTDLDDEDEGVAFAIVYLSGQTSPGGMFAVKVVIDGGSAGSTSADCSFTYTAKTLNGKVITGNLNPEKRRFPLVPYTTTPDDSIGAAYYDAEGFLHLWDANELPDLVNCGSGLV